MVVLGNPPYSVSSSNKGDSIMNLIKVYKENLNERNIQPLSDDYIKFIRFAENQIEKNGSGIVAMITNNSFIDGITHRQMRKHLMETFDEIYILDLHGNAKKKETTPDGGKDENVFSIMQGVSINIFVKTSGNKELAKVYHSEFFGKQKNKYEKLNESSFETVKWKKLKTLVPYYFFVPKDFGAMEEYEKGFKIDEMFGIYNSGVETGRDALFIDFEKKNLKNRMILISNDLGNLALINKYKIENTSGYNMLERFKNQNFSDKYILPGNYRPFDIRSIYYDPVLVRRNAFETMQHFVEKENLGLLCCKRQTSFDFQHVFIANKISERCSVSLQTGEVSYVFPLYLYHDDRAKTPNLDQEIIHKIESKLDLIFTTEPSFKELGEFEIPPVAKTQDAYFYPEDLLDYIYAVLHSPNYREKYKEFLKIDFPRVPYPKDKVTFWNLVKLGRELRGLHLLESPKVSEFITTFSIGGSNIIDKKCPNFENGNVYINETQYFGNVPELAWNFYIGGYQPAQKWLKDRRERELSVEDIEHYQQMIVALSETGRIMCEIDKIINF
jgi:predicted helicase